MKGNDRRAFVNKAMMHLIYAMQAAQPTFHGDKQSATRIRDALKHVNKAAEELQRAELVAAMDDNALPLMLEPAPSPAREIT